ncbi:hypothetical protein [Henriciella aquimarina]|uniref:hypothetical protein n=1 Tax=Henriciella aquimarina TaxID=545261 RepID=UPI000A075DDB|nr:hypothetical protein [Henriciella aquimarina]
MTQDVPEHKHFEASNRQYLVLAIVGAVFVIMLWLMRGNDDAMSVTVNVWLTVLFAIVTLIGAAAFLLKRAWLTLDADGFSSSELRPLGKIAWSDVSEFRLHKAGSSGLPTTQQVIFELEKEDQQTLSHLSGLLFRGSIRLTEDYRIKARDLVELMNAFRERARAGQGVSS